MARQGSGDPTPPDDGQVVDIDVSEEMRNAFLEYSVSVIHSRALPDARDGLKPVQRRILFSMHELGLRPDRGHVKSSRVVGDVMGKYHPHGDQAIYDALVRLAQPFTLRMPLVDGHGNFGSLDAGPAAARYTEARLAQAAMLMVTGLDEDTVDLVPNYDDQFLQPGVLPAAYPNLLVNGASGIAVGMATSMPPHNLVEVISAARHLIAHPEATLDDLMRFVPGPDFPEGGTIVGLDGIREAYATGRGSFKTRATTRIEKLTPRKMGIVVTELPYLIGVEKVVEKIKDLVTAKRLTGISNLVDLTDRKNGTRLVVEIKNGFNPEAVLAQLYRLTPMEDSFGINNVALVGGQPRTLGLKDLLQVFVDFRLDVVRRRTAYRLARREERVHLVEGLLIAILDIDEVIQVIRSSDDTAMARARLMSVFDLSQAQADYILELQLRRLTRSSPGSSWRSSAIGCTRRSPSSGRCWRTRVCCAASSRANSPRSPRPMGPPAGPSSSNPRVCPRRALRWRSPTIRAGSCSPRPGCSPAPPGPIRSRRTGPGPSTMPSSGRCAPRRAAPSVRHDPWPGAPPLRPRPAHPPPDQRGPEPLRRDPDHGIRPTGRDEDASDDLTRPDRWSWSGLRDRARRRQTGGPGLSGRTDRLGDRGIERRRRGGRSRGTVP